jgi:hypothetical protein
MKHESSEYTSASMPYLKPETHDNDDDVNHASHDLRITDDGVFCKTCNRLVYGNAEEDLNALLDPAPVASLATLLGGAVKDPIENKVRSLFTKEVDGAEWTTMTQEERRNELLEQAIDIGQEDLDLVAGKDWADLLPTIKWKLKNSTVDKITEAETYKNL